MKVLYSHRTKSADGQYVHIESLVTALGHADQEVTLCGPDGVVAPGHSPVRAMDAGRGEKSGLMARLPKAVYEIAEFMYSIPAWWRLQRAARQQQPDFIYERYNLFFLAGLWLKKSTGLPLLLEVNAPLREERAKHGGLALSGLARWTERQMWQGADVLLPVTQALADKIIAEGVDPSRIHVIPNGIHLADYEQADGAAIRCKLGLTGKTVLGFTGFVRDWHGVEMILDYLALRRDPDLHLLIVGDGPYLPALKQRAQAANIEEQITFCGVVQRDELPDYVAAFDIALQPRATSYASPLKLFEYMAAGKAILAPAQGNIEEVLQDGKNALLFAPDHRDAMFHALDTFVQEPSIRASLGECARHTIINRDLTWDSNAKRIRSIAEALIIKKGA